MSGRHLSILIIIVFLFSFGCQDDSAVSESDQVQKSEKAGIQRVKSDPDPTADAYSTTGPDGNGGIILPSGRRITPASNTDPDHILFLPNFGLKIISSPDGQYAYGLALNAQSVFSIHVDSWTVEDTESVKTFDGLVLNSAGTRLWASGGSSQSVHEFQVTGGELTYLQSYKVTGHPTGIALSPDEQTLYVASSYGNRLAFVDLALGAEVDAGVCQIYPYAVVLNEAGTRAFVSNWGSRSVSVINTANGNNIVNILVGKNPEGLMLTPDGSLLYVANSDSDSLSIIDTAALAVVDTIDLADDPDVKGAMPTSLLYDNGRIYVTLSGYNSVAVLDAANNEILGSIPTGWYPTSIARNPAQDELFIINAKGQGWQPEAKAVYQPGSANRLDIPTDQELVAMADQVLENNLRPTTFYDDLSFASPIPTQVGVASQQIKHVVFVMKENKTYDSLLGDLSTGNGDPSLAIYPENITPNTHALARAFTNCDNLYSEAELSLQGHMWSTAMLCNDYVEKSWPGDGRQPLSGVEPAAIPEKKFMFQHLLDNGVEFRAYGQVVGTVSDMERLGPYINLKYGFFNMGISDEEKIDIVIEDIKNGIFPPMIFISLPNDHGEGTKEGYPTKRWYVADNDAALGKLVDHISHSPYWNETAIFVTQDDPQSQADHVDAHRTLGLVISPWARRAYLSSVQYSMMSMWMTMEMILGVPPLTHYDQYAAPMYDCFTMTPDYAPYNAIPNPIPFEINEKGAPLQAYSESEDWDAPDQVERMGEVDWAVMRPGVPFPHHLSVDPAFVEDPEEEAEEAKEYKEMVKAWTEYGKQRGIHPVKGDLFVRAKALLKEKEESAK